MSGGNRKNRRLESSIIQPKGCILTIVGSMLSVQYADCCDSTINGLRILRITGPSLAWPVKRKENSGKTSLKKFNALDCKLPGSFTYSTSKRAKTTSRSWVRFPTWKLLTATTTAAPSLLLLIRYLIWLSSNSSRHSPRFLPKLVKTNPSLRSQVVKRELMEHNHS